MVARIFKKEYARELLQIAEEDFGSLQALVESKKGRKENVLFFCQQVVEKSLKAVLCAQGLEVPFSHDLEAMLIRLGDHVPPLTEAICDLSPYATIRRYEQGRFEILESDLTGGAQVAKAVLTWAQDYVNRILS